MEFQTPATNTMTITDDFDSACSTPFVSAPSSPGRAPPSYGGGGFFYSAPASPIHFMLSTSPINNTRSSASDVSHTCVEATSFEFEFSTIEDVTTADELFLNGQIRPMKLSTHLLKPQVLSPLLDGEEIDDVEEGDGFVRGRTNRSSSLRRRARSMSPLRSNDDAFDWIEGYEENVESSGVTKRGNDNDPPKVKSINEESETTQSGASSRSSSVGRSSKRWVFLKEFLYRSKSEGRTSTSTNTNTNNNMNNINNLKFWTSLSFKDKKASQDNLTKSKGAASSEGNASAEGGKVPVKKAVNGAGISKRRAAAARSAHELHYTTNRAQAEELRRKTYLPYKQGLLGCLGFSSKSYGAMNGFARALNPVSSR